RRRAQAEPVRLRDDLVRKLLGLVKFSRDRPDLPLGEIVGQRLDHLLLVRQRELEGHGWYSAAAFVSTVSPRWLTAFSSSLPSPAGSAENVTVSPGATMPANRTASLRSRCGPPAASAATVAAMPIWSMP